MRVQVALGAEEARDVEDRERLVLRVDDGDGPLERGQDRQAAEGRVGPDVADAVDALDAREVLEVEDAARLRVEGEALEPVVLAVADDELAAARVVGDAVARGELAVAAAAAAEGVVRVGPVAREDVDEVRPVAVGEVDVVALGRHGEPRGLVGLELAVVVRRAAHLPHDVALERRLRQQLAVVRVVQKRLGPLHREPEAVGRPDAERAAGAEDLAARAVGLPAHEAVRVVRVVRLVGEVDVARGVDLEAVAVDHSRALGHLELEGHVFIPVRCKISMTVTEGIGWSM